MSLVTNAILAYGSGEHEPEDQGPWVDIINKFSDGTTCEGQGFVGVEDTRVHGENWDWYGGHKRLECYLAIAAFNYLDLTALVRHLRSLPWYHPEDVQLFIKREVDDRFQLIDIFPDAKHYEPLMQPLPDVHAIARDEYK